LKNTGIILKTFQGILRLELEFKLKISAFIKSRNLSNQLADFWQLVMNLIKFTSSIMTNFWQI